MARLDAIKMAASVCTSCFLSLPSPFCHHLSTLGQRLDTVVVVVFVALFPRTRSRNRREDTFPGGGKQKEERTRSLARSRAGDRAHENNMYVNGSAYYTRVMMWCGRHAREAAWDCAARANAAARESTGCDAGGAASAALGRRRNYESK